MKNTYLLLLICCLFFSCNRNADDSGLGLGNELANLNYLDDGWLTFGWFYGECIGETCIEIYEMNQSVLNEDKLDTYPSGEMSYQGDFEQATTSTNGFFVPVSTDAFLVLMEEFPIALLDETEVVIGQPDAGDWGGIYLEYTLGEVKQYWLIDQMKSNVPEYLHDYIDLVNTKIAQLSQD